MMGVQLTVFVEELSHNELGKVVIRGRGAEFESGEVWRGLRERIYIVRGGGVPEREVDLMER